MRTKVLITAIVAAATLTACYTRPVVVHAPAPVMLPAPVLVPVPTAPPMAMTLHDRVHAALSADMGSAASGISVRVDGNAVYLTGTVGSMAARTRAHDVAHAVSGVGRVDHSGLVVR